MIYKRKVQENIMDPHRLIPGDATLIENIVSYLKAKGIFDEFRHECLADVDTKSSFQNLNQRVDGYASKFLATEIWNPDLNKNELRNKLRRHIDESGMLAVGADHVVEQVINPKIHSFFLPKIIEVVHQYVREQTEQLHKKADILNENSASDSIAPKARSAISDPIADILSFTHSKAKLPAISNAAQQKHVELKKKKEEDLFVKKREDELVVEKRKKEDEPAVERKKKEDEPVEKKKKEDESVFEKKNILETVEVASKNLITSGAIEEKSQLCDKEIKKEKVEEPDPSEEALKKVIKEEIKSEDKKIDNVKMHSIEIAAEESKMSLLAAAKSSICNKKDSDRSKHKLKPTDSSKVSGVSKEAKKPKKESLEKHQKQKSNRALKEPSSPVKNVTLSKTLSKEEKLGQISKSKSSDSSSSKTSDSSHKKSDSSKRDNSNSRHKKYSEKSEKHKVSQTGSSVRDLSHQLSSTDKGSKAVQYSSSQDSSQGSDQERSSKKAKQKHFIKHSRKDCSEKQYLGNESKSICEKKLSEENYAKKQQHKMEKISKSDKPKDMTTLGEVSKISSRSNSFGSTSSVGSSSNINSVSNSDDACENSNKDKKKRKTKEPCHPSNTLPPPPPPPPPPPSTSLACELTSSAEMSSVEETQSSNESEELNSVESSENSSSDSEVDANISVPDMLEKDERNSTNSENEFYDIFLYSSSSSEFEGYGSSSEKINPPTADGNMDVSVSSVHTSELSSYDDELSDDGFTFSGETESSTRRLTLKKAQQLLQDRAALRLNNSKNSNVPENSQDKLTDLSINSSEQKSSLFSSEDEFVSEPKRSLRRERKLNPRYASSEYTSIFNSKKETFITKQASPIKHMQSPNSSPIVETKLKKKRFTKNLSGDENSLSPRARSVSENDPARKIETHDIKQELEDSEIQKILQNAEIRRISVDEKNLKKPKIKKCLEDLKVHKILVKIETKEESVNRESAGKTEVSDDCKVHPEITIENSSVKMRHSKEAKIGKEKKYENEALRMSVNDAKYQDDSLPLSEEMDTTIDEEQLFKENNKAVSFADHLKVQLKLKPQNSSQFNMNSHSVKRKLKVSEAPPAKRPCSRSSVDSSSSEPAANENKPFNSEMQNSLDDKLFRVHELNVSDLPDAVKSELFCKQRTNNNGDILILNSHGKTSEKKTKESSSSKELSAL